MSKNSIGQGIDRCPHHLKPALDSPVDLALKKKAWTSICFWHEEWSRSFSLACRCGCSSCCTRSVTMTELEGTILREYLVQEGKADLLRDMPVLAAGDVRPRSTTNQFAAACREGIETAGESDDWNLAPCPFLAANRCTVYPARPFGCRAFASQARCSLSGSAVVPSLLLTVNTILLQLIEHLNQGGRWGNMLDLLATMKDPAKTRREPPPNLLTCQPCPGFLIHPKEQAEVEQLITRLFQEPIETFSLGQLLGMGQKSR